MSGSDSRRHADLVVTGGPVLTMDADRRILETGAVAILGREIVAVDERARIEADWEPARVIDTDGDLIMPGLVNAHTHILQTLLRGGPSQDREVYDWMVNVLYPGLWHFEPEDAVIATKLYATEAIRGGVTTVIENCDHGRDDDLSSAAIKTLDEMGLRAAFARLFYDHMSPELRRTMEVIAYRAPGVNRPLDMVESTDDAISHTESLIERFHDTADGRIRVWPAPAMPHTTTDEGIQRAFEIAREVDTMVSLHVAESPRDANNGQLGSIEVLDALGGVNDRLVAAHCVWMNDRAIRLMAAHDARISHNPVSNLYLASGIAPIARLIESGVTVGLGTDDANCNESASMIQEMKFAALLQRGQNLDSSALTSEKTVEMATIDGARAVGLEGQVGQLAPGSLADLIVIDLDVPQLKPLHNLANALVFQAYGSEVTTTIVNGEVLMEGKELTRMSPAEEADLRIEAQAASERIVARAGLTGIDRGWRTRGI